MLRVRFEVPGDPVGKGRARATVRRGKNGAPIYANGRIVLGHYTPQKTVTYESTVALFAAQAMAGRPPVRAGLALNLDIRLAIPPSWSKKKQAAARAGTLLATKKPDADNVEKAIKDACNGVVWTDDVLVVRCTKAKTFSDSPGVTVEIEQIPGELP